MFRDFSFLQIVLAVFGIGALIAWHEFGHYLIARLSGMRVVRFSVGMGPKLWSTTKNGIEYQLAAIPFGGFVQVFGMTPMEEGASDDPRAYINRPRWARIAMLAAGPGFNYLLAAVLFFIAFAVWPGGDVYIRGVAPGSAAQAAGLEPGDVITAVDGRGLISAEHFVSQVQLDTPLHLTVQRNPARQAAVRAAIALDQAQKEGADDATIAQLQAALDRAEQALQESDPAQTQELNVEVTPQNQDGRAVLGIDFRFGGSGASAGLGQIALYSVVICYTQSVATLVALSRMFAPDSKVKVSGPVGITKALSKAAEKGARDFIKLLALLSLTLGLFNLLPIPALDGIKILFLLVESIARRDLFQTAQVWINVIGLLLLMLLMVGVTIFVDVFG